MVFQTEIEFRLPKGYVDSDGVLHRDGVMRLATAADEILPLKDPRVQQNPAYLTIIVLARVVTRLGTLQDINTKVIEGLFASDLGHLQALYERLNGDGDGAALDRSEGDGESAGRERPNGAARPLDRSAGRLGVLGEA